MNRRTRNVQQRHPVSSRRWCQHFLKNADSQLDIPWSDGPQLTETERRAIAKSVQTFQLGESGQGRHITRVAMEYANRSGDADYAEAMRLFIREEQRHGGYLGRFLDIESIPRIDKQWNNVAFYWLRHRVGLELTIFILLTAELIARVYYVALRDATTSTVLRRICDQLLKDEAAHVRFQTDRVALLRLARPGWLVRVIELWERVFFRGTCIAVWWTHRRALRAGGMGFRDFLRRTSQELRIAQHRMRPTSIARDCVQTRIANQPAYAGRSPGR